ncbi:hypothetical protein CF68_04160 [Cupriavidus sp. SK-4]|uniref:DUF4123 domain-containing protein n=1 Tax=Cupriavidus sp. SK-4 TaxID=574750 RepID=UPI0004529EA5|nr:DUF4123 domain-containing protein [Cupriavidus sp. SK-4]EYS97754.1 hypothetical protein CF68_04160 [Cupriavidus sp. SK-4]
MFFAVAPSSPQLAGDLLDKLRWHLEVSPNARLYALIDGLLVPDIADLCHQQGWPALLSVYAGYPGYDSGHRWAPCLLELPRDSDPLAPRLATLVAHCSGIPALGFLISRHPAEVVKAQFMCLAGITDGDGKRWLLRFADTRVWPPEHGWLTAEQQTRAFAGMDVWLTIERHGQVRTVSGCPEAAPARPDELPEDFRVTERQLVQLSGANEADYHLARMSENPYHAQLARSPIEQYDTVRKALATLDRLDIEDEQQRFAYAALCGALCRRLRTGPRRTAGAAVREQQGSFPDRFVEVPAELSARHNSQRKITHATTTQPDFCLPD